MNKEYWLQYTGGSEGENVDKVVEIHIVLQFLRDILQNDVLLDYDIREIF